MSFPCHSLSFASACRTDALWAKLSVRKGKKNIKNAYDVTLDSIKMYNYKKANYTYLILKLVFLDIILPQSRCGKLPLNSPTSLKSALALRLKWIQAK